MKDKIAQIRERFEKELNTTTRVDGNANPRFNPIDIERVRTEDWQISRYLIDANGDTNEAYCNLLKTLEWKQSFEVHKLTEKYFPTEWYQLYKVEKYGTDKAGLPIFTEAFKQQRYYAELDVAFRKLVAVSMEQMDRIAGENGMMYLGDFTDTPLATLDVSLARFRVEILNKHYPLLAKKIVLVNVPFLLKPIIKFVVSFMKPSIKDAVMYTNTADLPELVDLKILHADLNGLRTERHYPETVSFRTCYARFSVKPAFVEYFFKYNQLE